MTITKTAKLLAYACILGALSSCQAANTPTDTTKVDQRVRKITPLPSVYTAFSCIPEPSALVAAHRGTDESTEYPENALLSLQALHENGVQFAEVDVARLNDGTHILFHDGVWDERSNGKGPIAATKWAYAQSLLLKDTDGNLTSVRPSRLDDVLAWAKDRLYLEIDFKSSANPKAIIDMVRAAGMIEQVVLIAYNPKQALDLHALAPEAMISVSIFKTGDLRALEARGLPTKNMAAWVGKGDVEPDLLARLKKKNIPILMASFFELDDELQKTKTFDTYKTFAGPADLIVSDYAFVTQQTLDSYNDFSIEYEMCLKASK